MIFQTDRLTKRYTYSAILMQLVYGAILMFFISIILGIWLPQDITNVILFLLLGLFILARLVERFEVSKIYEKRKERLMAFADANSVVYDMVPDSQRIAIFRNIAPFHLEKVRDAEFDHFIHSDEWDYAEFAYKIYWKLKSGEYQAATVHYGVMSAALPRELPNIFFDSKKARGRQFRFHFHRSQLHRLEGDFNDYFATYFPPEYSIDGLAIITPDVMWALKAAADYDIEMVGDRVFLYGPLYGPERQLPDMAVKLQAIRKELMDNILTYRDERLPYERGRKYVMPIGASLKRSKFWNVCINRCVCCVSAPDNRRKLCQISWLLVLRGVDDRQQ